MFNFYAHERPFMHCLYFICERNFYARTHVKITRHWISTLNTGLKQSAATTATDTKKANSRCVNIIVLIPLCSICQILANFLELNYKD